MFSKPELIGGKLCLDFVNTVGWRGREEPVEQLSRYRDWLRWCERTGVASRARARALTMDEAAAAPFMTELRGLRELLYRIFLRWLGGRSPAAADIERFNRRLEETSERRAIVRRGRSFDWKVPVRKKAGPEVLTWPVLWSAAELLVEGDRKRVRRCAGEACGWLFYDGSRTGNRRWCSMNDCGNRAKAKRHYARTKGTLPRA